MMKLDCRQFDTTIIFEEFAANKSAFLSPHLKKFNTDLLIMGESIAGVHRYFLPVVRKKWQQLEQDVPVAVVEYTERG
ncbi:hypothetical protein [Sinomicrobium sp. M5D2P9]